MNLTILLFLSSLAYAADPPPVKSVPGLDYTPPSPAGTSPLPGQNGNIGSQPRVNVPTPDTIPPPSAVQAPATPSLGQFRNKQGDVNISKMFLDRYKEAVVRVRALDLAGNELAVAMGVGVGRGINSNSAQYIATPLSLILGNSQQWADRIEISHYSGNKYSAKIAVIDEEKNLVLLAPEATPASMPFVTRENERPQIDVYTIYFDTDPEGKILPKIIKGKLAAASSESGILSIAAKDLENTAAGTGIINAQGELVGMLLPGGRGVLSSSIQKMIAKAQRQAPIEPGQIGTILGRGVIVDPNMEGAFKSINAAIEAIVKGEAPKTDPNRYFPAKDRSLAPKESDKVVVKVMPGNYKETKTIILPSNISLAGSGVDKTRIYGKDPEKPVLLAQNIENILISGIRFTPAPLQQMKAPTIIFSKVVKGKIMGNVVEARNGVGIWLHESRNIEVSGNTFPRAKSRAISCDRSNLVLEANAFLGDWDTAVTVDKDCNAKIQRNIFIDNKISISTSALLQKALIQRNTFYRSINGIKISGGSKMINIDDNLFFELAVGINSDADMEAKQMGRNSVWKTKFMNRPRPIPGLDIIKLAPSFENPDLFDFRMKAGKGQVGSAGKEKGGDLGAFQREDYLGNYTNLLAKTLGATVGEDLEEAWGLKK